MHIYISIFKSTKIILVSEPVKKVVCSGINTRNLEGGINARSNLNKIPQSVSFADKIRLSLMITKILFLVLKIQ